MNNCSNCVSDPISSNQVVDVNLLKPSCADFCGNTLNDWLKWLADKQCEFDLSDTDLDTIKELLEQEPTEINIQTIINSVIEAISNLYNLQQECCDQEEYQLVADEWTEVRTLRALRDGRQVTLTGSATASTGYTGVICTIDPEITPSFNLTIPLAHDFAPTTDFNVFLRVLVTGEIRLQFTGTTPSGGSSRTIYLDGVSYFLN